MKKILCIIVLLIGCVAYWQSLNDSSSHKIIAITQIVDHPSLNQARKGVIAALADAGYKEGEQIKIIYETPQGNISIGSQIAQKLNSLQPDVIVAISTTSAQT